ncbi:MAG: ATP-NAD kinase family protein [Candidatus Poseidoniaceae archaeon]|nr:ATP-NAD kinase family protein [Candidatus Poseidoniaceae archaeon]MBL6895997.1 ATP-NAD kinase family protein [Candidatus Poseidoniaceae archaeon]
MRVGIVVNPDAGLGGRLGFKGSDGRAAEAREAGAQDRAGPRMTQCIVKFDELLNSSLNRSNIKPEIYTWEGRMGGDWLTTLNYQSIGKTPALTNALNTNDLVQQLIDNQVDVILYAGGDGTTRDIVNALGDKKIPLIGVPGGVKMHSGCFATTPNAAAEVLFSFAIGDLMSSITEVMDLDEEIYLAGEWKVRMYGEALTPASPRFMQGSKQQVERASEEEIIEGLAAHIADLIEADSNLMVVWGSGGTLRMIGDLLNQELTLLGIDIQHNDKIYADLNEEQLIDILQQHTGNKILLLSPMGGQGFLIGRGNLQLSPTVLRLIGISSVLGVATPAKLTGLSNVRIDTGDSGLDQEFRERKFVKMLQGYRTTRVIRVSDV